MWTFVDFDYDYKQFQIAIKATLMFPPIFSSDSPDCPLSVIHLSLYFKSQLNAQSLKATENIPVVFLCSS